MREPCLQLVGECESYASLDFFVVRKTVNLPLKNGHEQSDENDKEFDKNMKYGNGKTVWQFK